MSSRSRISEADGELLSAWLGAELDEVTSANLERRLRAEPDLASHVDAQRDLLVALRRLDDVRPPDGYRERLSARLAGERAAKGDASRGRGAPRASVLTAAAAGLIMVAALGGAARWLAAPSSAGAGDEQASGAAEISAFAESDREAAATGILVDEGVTVPAPAEDPAPLQEVASRLRSSQEARGLLGLPVQQRADVASDARAAAAAALPGDQCLQRVLADDGGIPARIDLLTVGDSEALAVTLVAASPGSQVLDVVRVVVVDRADCGVVLAEPDAAGTSPDQSGNP